MLTPRYRRYAIGFCDERTPLDGVQLGWQYTSWGYHGDDGTTSHGSRYRSTSFGEAYGEGDVIGCGVNFAEEIAFYTVNGEIVGRAFCEIRGKLYPAISVDVRMGGCKFTAMFWEGGTNGNKDFMFKGPFNDKRTLIEPPGRLERKRRASLPQWQDSSSDTDTSDSSSDLDSD
ncbi:ran-binding protein [Trichoderma sp. SZMC 28014]